LRADAGVQVYLHYKVVTQSGKQMTLSVLATVKFYFIV
jgi:hypothetical protein